MGIKIRCTDLKWNKWIWADLMNFIKTNKCLIPYQMCNSLCLCCLFFLSLCHFSHQISPNLKVLWQKMGHFCKISLHFTTLVMWWSCDPSHVIHHFLFNYFFGIFIKNYPHSSQKLFCILSNKYNVNFNTFSCPLLSTFIPLILINFWLLFWRENPFLQCAWYFPGFFQNPVLWLANSNHIVTWGDKMERKKKEFHSEILLKCPIFCKTVLSLCLCLAIMTIFGGYDKIWRLWWILAVMIIFDKFISKYCCQLCSNLIVFLFCFGFFWWILFAFLFQRHGPYRDQKLKQGHLCDLPVIFVSPIFCEYFYNSFGNFV